MYIEMKNITEPIQKKPIKLKKIYPKKELNIPKVYNDADIPPNIKTDLANKPPNL